ncbi:DUF1491 family protein [Brucellaceae bacterium C25G]
MRLTSEFWVSALIRRIRLDGGFAYLNKRGSGEAGALFIKKRCVSESFHQEIWELYAPAPQSVYDDRKPDDRVFILLMYQVDNEACEQRLLREKKFDSDLWILEIEDIEDLSPYISIVPDPYA